MNWFVNEGHKFLHNFYTQFLCFIIQNLSLVRESFITDIRYDDILSSPSIYIDWYRYNNLSILRVYDKEDKGWNPVLAH